MDCIKMEYLLKERTPGPMTVKRHSAVLVLLAGDRLVLEVRSRKLRRQPGEVCCPGGRMEQRESVIQCALRETGEELGLPAEEIQVIGELDYLVQRSGQIIYPVLARCGEGLLERLKPNPAEVERVLLVPLPWLKNQQAKEYTYRQENCGLEELPEQIARSLRSYPTQRRGIYWEYDGACIWGMTGMILSQLLELIEEAE